MKIYTKTGDHGETSLVGGQRTSKCCQRLECYGTTDELNALVGILITYCDDPADVSFLCDVQAGLFVVGGYLATDTRHHPVRPGNVVTAEMVEAVEAEIDRLNDLLPPLRLFVMPRGCRGAAFAHSCRTVCRRAERHILRLIEQEQAVIDEPVLAYMNRLSDYFFVLARKLNYDNNIPDAIWKRMNNEQ